MTTVQTQLANAVKGLIDAEPEATAKAIVLTLLATDAELIERWKLERLTEIVTGTLRKATFSTRPISEQLAFPGFENLARKLPLGSRFVMLREATVPKLKKCAATLRKQVSRENPKVASLEKLIKAMEPYAKKRSRLTVAEFYELRAGKLAKPALPAAAAVRN